MIIKDNFNLSYDLSGNLVLTIPKFYIRNTERNILLKSVERLIRSATEKIKLFQVIGTETRRLILSVYVKVM